MRLLSFTAVLAALAFATPASAQDAPAPDPRSTYVAPTHPGEAVRVTTYERRPEPQGRLARRYKGVRANRSTAEAPPVVRALPVARTYSTTRAAFVRRGGSFFQVLPRR